MDKKGLVVAADVMTLESLEKLCDILYHYPIYGIKIGFSLVYQFGMEKVLSVIDSSMDTTDIKLIYDHQKAGTDIPRMGEVMADINSICGIHSVIVFPMAGPKTLEGFVKPLHDSSIRPIVGLTMTHGEYLVSEGGYISDDAPIRILEKSLDLGVLDFVMPSNKLNLIDKYMLHISKVFQDNDYEDSITLSDFGEISIYTPGIGTQGGQISRVLNSVNPHNYYPIVGSAIYKNPDPAKVVCELLYQLNLDS